MTSRVRGSRGALGRADATPAYGLLSTELSSGRENGEVVAAYSCGGTAACDPAGEEPLVPPAGQQFLPVILRVKWMTTTAICGLPSQNICSIDTRPPWGSQSNPKAPWASRLPRMVGIASLSRSEVTTE